MPRSLLPRPTPGSIARYVDKHASAVKAAQRQMHMAESVREADYKGHHIVIRTSYNITVDGVPITGHMGVTDDGRVHYHPVPNASFPSAIDMVKRIIDVFPDDFTRKGATGRRSRGPGMGGMRMAARRAGRS